MGFWNECRHFFGEFRSQVRNTGSILPSSRYLARALCNPLSQVASPRRILEIGPGTGAVTNAILKQLRPDDHLDIVEINPNFVAYLNGRFEQDPEWKRVVGQTRILNKPLQDLEGQGTYDFLVSGLPLNNFSMSSVREIFGCYQRLLRPGGTLSYFEYLSLRTLKRPFVGKSERRRLRVLTRYFRRMIAQHQVGADLVFRNAPPAVARHFRFGHAGEKAEPADILPDEK